MCSCRMPPYITPEEAKSIITDLLTTDVPYNAKVNVDFKMCAEGFFAPIYPKNLEEILDEAAREAFDNNPIMFNHEGGSIPFMNLLQKNFPSSYFMVTGLLGPGSNAHAGNECIRIDVLKKLL